MICSEVGEALFNAVAITAISGRIMGVSGSFLEPERHAVVPHIDIVCHFERVRELGIRIAADHKTFHALAVFAEVLLDPAHVTKNLTNDLIGRAALLEFNDDEGA
jgi:hypothetical protein